MDAPFLLGLTGSIGTGKTTTAKIFAEADIPVWDADAAVARAYGAGGAAVGPISDLDPALIEEGAVSKPRLKEWIARDKTALQTLEVIVHPIVARDRQAFIEGASSDILLFDIPLLFETGAEAWLDAVVVVTIDPASQKSRVLARGTMTEQEFDLILARQMPDAEKRARADYVIETRSMDHARASVAVILRQIRESRHA